MTAVPRISLSLRLHRLIRALAIDVVPKPFAVADLEEAVARAQERQHGWLPVGHDTAKFASTER